jgi:gliding motility-associated lipoprotein GldD
LKAGTRSRKTVTGSKNQQLFWGFAWPVLTICIILLMASCGEDYSPKPRGYFRIDLPEKEYHLFDTTYPYSFEYPIYARVIPDDRGGTEPYWINIDFPAFGGRIYISYKKVSGNLITYLEDSRTFVMKHIPKADAIDDSLILRREDKVFGLLYTIHGTGAASPYQFFLTDSTTHFVRGALYFNVTPNNDSLAPVIQFIHADIDHLISTFRWK